MKNNHNKPDTLHIKNNAKNDLVYHYNRNERLALLHKKRDKPAGKGFFRNKILLIIVCDIILIILIFYIVHHFILKEEEKPDTATIDMDVYHIRLSGYRIKDKVFARLYIEKVKNAENEGESEQQSVDILFSIDNENPVQLKEKLPGKKGEEIKVQATLVSGDPENELSAQAMIGNKTETLTILPLER